MTASPPFEHRGIVEGFYGPPWRHIDRVWWVEALGRLGMNRYVVAPKSDPVHREEWRQPYPADALAGFGALVELGEREGVRLGFGASPGLSIRPSDPADVSALLRKLASFHALGCRFLVLALDDVPSRLQHPGDRSAFASLAAAHVHLAHAIRGAFPDATLWLVPNDYAGAGATDYLDELGETLAPEVEVAWTGRSTIAPTLTAAEAAARAACLRRRLLLWDNVPVSDGPMRAMLHLGAYVGRDPELAESASGILLNAMERPRSSFVTVACAAAYLRDPGGYDPERAWRRAVETLGEGASDAFRTFAGAHRFSPLDPGARDGELEHCFRALQRCIQSGADPATAIASLRSALTLRRDTADALRAGLHDRELAAELEPWIQGHHEESRRMDAAAQALECVFDPATDAMDRVRACSVFEGSLTLHPPPAVVSYGPRRCFYPQLVSHRDDSAGFGPDPALFTRMSLSDEIVAFAEASVLPRIGARKQSGAPAAAQRDEER